VENRTLQVTKHFDCTEELVEIVGQARLGVVALCIGKEIDLWFSSLWLVRETGVHVQEAVANEPTDSGEERKRYEETWKRQHVSIYRLRSNWRLETNTYSVVKFIVNVRLMEKRVNNAVGSVIVVKVTTQ
jgi:hypothetical protein